MVSDISVFMIGIYDWTILHCVPGYSNEMGKWELSTINILLVAHCKVSLIHFALGQDSKNSLKLPMNNPLVCGIWNSWKYRDRAPHLNNDIIDWESVQAVVIYYDDHNNRSFVIVFWNIYVDLIGVWLRL